MATNDLRVVDLSIQPDEIEAGALRLLNIIRPQWKECDIECKPFTAGISNRLLFCRWKCGVAGDEVLVRVYGNSKGLLVNRDVENLMIRVLHATNHAQPLFCKFNNGIAYGYAPGVIVDVDTVRDPVVGRLIAREIASLHTVDIEKAKKEYNISGPIIQREARLLTTTSEKYQTIPEKYNDPLINERIHATIGSQKMLVEELEMLQSELQALGSPVVFCHNDLLLNNIVYDKDAGKVKFIDFEYSAYNYEASEIAMHFAEHTGIDSVDYSRYFPSKEYQLKWLRVFLECKAELQDGAPVTDRDVEKLYVQVSKFVLDAHLSMAVWSLRQIDTSAIGFDFVGYAIIRYREYCARKKEFLNMEIPD